MDEDLFSWTLKIEDYEYDLLYEKLINQYPEACFVCIDYLTFAKIRLRSSSDEESRYIEKILKHRRRINKIHKLNIGISYDGFNEKIIFDPSKFTKKTEKLVDVYSKVIKAIKEAQCEVAFVYRTTQNASADYERLLKKVHKCKNRHDKVCF